MIVNITNKFILALLTLAMYLPVSAVNWLFLQGTENQSKPQRPYKFFGFLQPTYMAVNSRPLPAGSWKGEPAVFNLIAPDFTRSDLLYIIRARLGVRGEIPGLERKVNYLLLTEFGHNLISKPVGIPLVTDASITLNYLPYARLRIGQFKYPGPEEGMLAVFRYPYINYSTVLAQLMMERFFDNLGEVPGNQNSLNGSLGANRDIGVQIFDHIMTQDYEHSYALMIGQGNGLNRFDNNQHQDLYLYWSTESLSTSIKWKSILWGQWGTRTLSQTDYSKFRSGLGFFAKFNQWRLGGEWLYGRGVIYAGTDGGAAAGTKASNQSVASYNVLAHDEANGGYIDVGYKMMTHIQWNVRYDFYKRATKTQANYRFFETWTLGGEYFFHKDVRLAFNYEIRSAEAPKLDKSHAANLILNEMSDRYSLQLSVIF